MPELPEVETVCRALRPVLIGRVVEDARATVQRLRLPLDAAKLARHSRGRTIADVRRRGKYILAELSGCRALVIHLGMTGSLRICPSADELNRYDRVIWDLRGGDSWRLADIRRFASVQTACLSAPGAIPGILASLGAEPLDPEFAPEDLHRLTQNRSRPIKNLIMDQAVLVGVGNIYASEALYRARIDPTRPSRTLVPADCARLLGAIRETLSHAIEAGGSTIVNFRSVDGSEGQFARELSVYGRKGEPCSACGPGSPVLRIVQAGRSTFYCPGCQR